MKKIAINYNSAKYIYLFRIDLIHALIHHNYEVTLICPEDDYLPMLKELDVNIEIVELNPTGISIFQDLKYFFSLVKIFKKNKITASLNFTIKPNIYGSLAAKFSDTKSISTITGLGTAFLQNNLSAYLARFLYKFSLKKSDLIFFQNKYDQDIFLSNNICSIDNSSLVPGSGINTNVFVNNTPKKYSDRIHFMFVGRLIREKGIVELLKALKKITNNYKNIDVSIVGGRDESCPITVKEQQYYENDLSFKFYGNIRNIKEVMETADCIVLPSYREGTSRALLEACSLGIPCIASDVPGCNNVIIDKYNGFLCSSNSIDSLYNSLMNFVKLDLNERVMMGKNARSYVIENFEQDIVIRTYLSKIEEIL